MKAQTDGGVRTQQLSFEESVGVLIKTQQKTVVFQKMCGWPLRFCKIKDFNGDYSEYRSAQKQWDRDQRKQDRELDKTQKEQIQQNAPKIGLTQEQKKEVKRLEKSINKLEEKKKMIGEKFNDTNLSPADIEKYGRELTELSSEIEEKELLWMELADQA